MIPLAIHFWLRRRPRVEKWGATRFLRNVLQRKQTRLRMQSLSQLLVRLGIVALLVICAAGPQATSNSSLAITTGPKHHLLIIDVSLSMSAQEAGQSRLERARKQIDSLLASSPPGDSWQLLLHGTQSAPDRIHIPTFNAEQLRGEVAQLSSTYQTAYLSETLDRAISLLNESSGLQTEILFWTDLPAADWQTSGNKNNELTERLNELSQLGNLTIIDISGAPGANLAVTHVGVKTEPVRLGKETAIDVSVASFSTQKTSSFVRIQIDEDIVAEEQVSFDSIETQTIPFKIVFTKPGRYHATVKIADDALLADNTYHFVVQVSAATNVLIVEQPSQARTTLQQSDFLKLALEMPIESAEQTAAFQFNLSSVSPAQFRTTDLKEVDVLLICDFPNLTTGDALRLRDYVVSGRGILFSMSPAVSLDDYNNLLGSSGVEILPASLKEQLSFETTSNSPFQIGQIHEQHPVVEPFKLYPEAGLPTTRIYRYVRAEPGKNATRIVDMESGDPLILENTTGLGKTYLVLTAFDPTWGSWVLWPSFLPMVNRIVDELARQDRLTVESIIGKPPLADLERLPVFNNIQNLAGQTLWSDPFGGEDIQLVLETTFTLPGAYLLHSSQPYPTTLTVVQNVDTRESNLLSIGPRELLTSPLLRDRSIELVTSVEPFFSQRHAFGAPQKSSLSHWLIFSAILLLLIDQLFSYQSKIANYTILGFALGMALTLMLDLSTTMAMTSLVMCMFAASFAAMNSPAVLRKYIRN